MSQLYTGVEMGPPALQGYKITPGEVYDEMHINIRIWHFPQAVQSMQGEVHEISDRKSVYEFIWGMNVGLPAKWRITLLNTKNTKNDANPLFGVALHLLETPIPQDQPIIGSFDVEIRGAGESTYLHAFGKAVNFNEPGKVTGFKRLAFIPDIIHSSERVLVDKEHLNLHMTFKIFGPETKTKSIPAISKTTVCTAVQKRFLALLNSNEDADLEIIYPGGKVLFAHKLILSAHSPVLKKLFKLPIGNLEAWDMTDPTSIIKSTTMRLLLKFMYGGVLDDPWKLNYENLLIAADLLRLDDLIFVLDWKLGEICTQQNSQQLLQLAAKFKLRRTDDNVKRLIQKWAQEKAQADYNAANNTNKPAGEGMVMDVD